MTGDLLITGGSGSFGHAMVERMLDLGDQGPRRIIIYSRDEYKQGVMRKLFDADGQLRFFLGDVRDLHRLRAAMRGVDTVVHAAALKQVPALEYNPTEAVKTNVLGAMNVVDAAIHCAVPRVVALSSDKACAPVNLYGATKLTAEKLFVAANVLAGADGPSFSCVRYGNVTGSRGSVVPVWRDAGRFGEDLLVTEPNATRFWMTLDQAVDFVLRCLDVMQGGEVFIPDLGAYRVGTLAEVIAKEYGVGLREVGLRVGEKVHERMISPDEAHLAWRWAGGYALIPKATIDQTVPIPEGAEPAHGMGGIGFCSMDARRMTAERLSKELLDVPRT